mmetsp:Transcript_1777/g.3558  ORF Transcript_1777/g.3558 Transcript_1777/m.3558 type:complete len:241 (+) Transcript_1777:491-1213(+)
MEKIYGNWGSGDGDDTKNSSNSDGNTSGIINDDDDDDQKIEETIPTWYEPRIPVNKLPPENAWDRFRHQVSTGISVGDVVVLQHPDRIGTVCKRVMGLPGDVVTKPTSRLGADRLREMLHGVNANGGSANNNNNNNNNETRGGGRWLRLRLQTKNATIVVVVVSRHQTRRTNQNQAPLRIVDCQKRQRQQQQRLGARSQRTRRQAGMDHGLPGTPRIDRVPGALPGGQSNAGANAGPSYN